MAESNIDHILKFHNVRIVNNGVIIKGLQPIKESFISKKSFELNNKKTFLLKYIFPNSIFTKKGNFISIINEHANNHYHWFCECLTKLIILKDLYPNSVLILRKSHLKNDFMVKSLEAFNIDISKIIAIRKKSNLKVSNLAFISNFNFDTFTKLSEVRKRILSHLSKSLQLNLGERIYISRNNPKVNTNRKVVNNEEVEKLLKKYQFKTVYMENYNFIEQLSIANHMKYLVAPHGAGMTYIIFMQQNGSVLELRNKNLHNKCFERIAKETNMRHLTQSCESKESDICEDNKDIIVDIKKLEKNLKQII